MGSCDGQWGTWGAVGPASSALVEESHPQGQGPTALELGHRSRDGDRPSSVARHSPDRGLNEVDRQGLGGDWLRSTDRVWVGPQRTGDWLRSTDRVWVGTG